MLEQKDILRDKYRERRLALSAEEVLQLSRKITKRLASQVPWGEVKALHTFLSIERLNEVNTTLLLDYVWRAQPAVKTYTSIIQSNQLMSVQIDSSTEYAPSQFGIPAPKVKLLENPKLDVIIVPVLAFDAERNRLGYGLGYYDRFLRQHKSALKIGVCYNFGFVREGIEAQDHDVVLDMIVTEKQLY